ncbi:hypothetical protein SynBIOSU31_03319 [Synechococcus sp. BIOS-U3-1]|nr:hypothetical protein SynBIOSU31_03319 [Synechococcus sp. BIOS-U3-1]
MHDVLLGRSPGRRRCLGKIIDCSGFDPGFAIKKSPLRWQRAEPFSFG